MALDDIRATPKQRRMLQIYLETGGDMVEAYERASGTDVSANVNRLGRENRAKRYFATPTMRKLLKEANVQAMIAMERKNVAGMQTAIEKYGITKERILEELAKIAFTNPTDVMEWDENGVRVKPSSEIGNAAGAIKEVASTGGGDKPVNMKVSLMDRRQALIDIGKEAFGMFTEKVEHRGEVAVSAKFIIEGKEVKPMKIIEGK